MVQPIVDGMTRPGLRYTVPEGHTGRDLCARLAQGIQNQCYTPGEKFGEDRCLFVLSKGIALQMGRVLLRGSVWGRDLLFQQAFLRESAMAIAFQHVIVQQLSLAALTVVFEPYPVEWAELCSQAARMSLIRCITLAAKRLRIAHTGSELGPDCIGLLNLVQNHTEHTMHLMRRGSVLDLLREHCQSGREGSPLRTAATHQFSDTSKVRRKSLMQWFWPVCVVGAGVRVGTVGGWVWVGVGV